MVCVGYTFEEFTIGRLSNEVTSRVKPYRWARFKRSPPWAAALTSLHGLIPSEPSASAERGTDRLGAAQLAGLVWSLADSHRVVRTRLVLGFGGWLMGPHRGLSLRGCFVQTCPFVIPDTL